MYVCGHLIVVNVEACAHLHELRSLHPLHWVTFVTTKGEGTAEEQLKYSGCRWKYSIFVHGQVANFFCLFLSQVLSKSSQLWGVAETWVAETWGEYRRGVVCRMLQAHVSVPHRWKCTVYIGNMITVYLIVHSENMGDWELPDCTLRQTASLYIENSLVLPHCTLRIASSPGPTQILSQLRRKIGRRSGSKTTSQLEMVDSVSHNVDLVL